MGGRSAAAKGSTLEPPGRPPRPSSADPAEPPEPRAPEPRAHRTPVREPQYTSARSKPAAAVLRPGPQDSSAAENSPRELTPRRSSSCYSSEPVQPPGSTSGRERKKRPPSGGCGPSGERLRPLRAQTRPHHVLIGHCRHRLPQGHASGCSRPDPGRDGPRSNQTGVLRLSLLGTELRDARCSPPPSICEGEAGKPESRMTLLQ